MSWLGRKAAARHPRWRLDLKERESTIDRDKVRSALRRLGDEYIFHMLDEAIELLPPIKLAKLVGGYLDVKQLRPDSHDNKTLLEEVRAFDAASRAGKYYESFDVNSKNYTTKSIGSARAGSRRLGGRRERRHLNIIGRPNVRNGAAGERPRRRTPLPLRRDRSGRKETAQRRPSVCSGRE